MRRIRALSLVAIAGATMWACTDGSGPTAGGRAVPLDLVPSFQLDPSLFSYDPIDRIRLVAIGVATSEVVGRFDEAVDPSAASWSLPLSVDLGDEASLVVIVEIELLSGTSVEWSGRAGPFTVRRGSLAQGVDVYRGPLDNLDVVSVDVDAPPSQLLVGGTVDASASVTLAAGSSATPVVFWASSNPTVASVTQEGPSATITGVTPGTTNIIATAGEAYFEFSLEVVAEVSGVDRTWQGKSTAWSDPNNWSPTGVPGPNDDVLIPSNPVWPLMSSDESIGSLTVGTSVLMNQNGFTLTVARDLLTSGGSSVTGGLIHLDNIDATPYQVAGTFEDLRVSAPRTVFGGTVTLTGDLDVRSELTIGQSTVTVNGDLIVQGANGSLVMDQVESAVGVYGNVTFSGASSVGNLTDGVLQVLGDFTATSANSPTSFQSGGTLVYLTPQGDVQTVSFDNAGPAGQHFADVYIFHGQGSVTAFETDALVTGLLFGGNLSLEGSGSAVLEVSGTLEFDVVSLDRLPLRLVSNVALGDHALENITFKNMPPNVDHLHIEVPGAGANSPLNIFSPAFVTVPSNGYYHLRAVNAVPAGQMLHIELSNPIPTPPPDAAYTAGTNVEVIWP